MPFGYTPKTSFGKSMARKTWGYDDAYQPSDEVAKEGAANPDVADALDEDLKRTESSVAQEKAGFTGDDAQDDFKASVNLSAQMEGEDLPDDQIVTGLTAALRAFPRIDEEFRSLHLHRTGRTKQDVYKAFLTWAEVRSTTDGPKAYNVDKALRKLQAFVDFQEEFFDKYFDTPVQPEEFDTFKAYIDLTVPDSSPTASPLWLFNGETSSLVPGEDIDGRTMVRWLWSLLVHSMFDEAAAAHGLVLVNNMAGLGMYQTLRSQREWRPLRSELVRQMVYEAMPIKIKEIVYVNSPWWMNAFLGTIRRFIPTALSDKLHNVDEDGLYEVLMAGPEDLPAGFCGGTGSTALRYPGF